ncbi:hypothetical protein Tco_1208181 [Tanacetum coccineum]
MGVLLLVLGILIAIPRDLKGRSAYTRATSCWNEGLIKPTGYIDLESEVLRKNPTNGPNDWWCRKCQAFSGFEVGTMYIVSIIMIKDNEATSKTASDITPLDLESQTEENTTPTNAHKSTATSPDEKEKTNKCKAEGEPMSESTNIKKKAVEAKIEKDP